jgi:leader peptidase (prepilin peptidase)/N-methyltransferase
MSQERILILTLLFLVGAYLGRFANRCAVRIPQKFELWETLVHIFKSYPLPFPGLKRRWYQLLPIIGTTFLPGWSPYSGRHVRQREPWVELVTGLLMVALYLVEVPASLRFEHSLLYTPLMPWQLLPPDVVAPIPLISRFLFHAVLFEALIIATLIDYDLYIIPDGVTVPAMAIGFLASLTGAPLFIVPLWFQDPIVLDSFQPLFPEFLAAFLGQPALPQWIINYPWVHMLLHSIVGFVVGGGIIWLVRIIGHFALGKEAMGFGDVILMAMIGMFIGWQPVVTVFFIAPMIALVVVILMFPFIQNKMIPYGPYLSLGTILMILCWPQIWPYAENFFKMGIIVPILAVIMSVMLLVTLSLMQVLKRMAGISLDDDYPTWSSGDHLMFYNTKKSDQAPSTWKQTNWPGEQAAQGQSHLKSWQNGQRF